MPKGIQRDLTGKKFGRIRVLGYSRKGANYNSVWNCVCECGTKFTCLGPNLTFKNTQSCGCGHGLALSNPITHEQLLKLLRYNKRTGEFIARRKWHRIKIGQVVGCVDINSGYRHINIGGESYYGHVLAWFYVTGEWPEMPVDHKNRKRAENHWPNLRLASDSQNNHNHPVRCDSRSGFKGVTRYFRNPTLWKAYIVENRKMKILGYETTPEAAARLYDAAAVKLRGKFARTNFGVGA